MPPRRDPALCPDDRTKQYLLARNFLYPPDFLILFTQTQNREYRLLICVLLFLLFIGKTASMPITSVKI
jgi:hypothetical protein